MSLLRLAIQVQNKELTECVTRELYTGCLPLIQLGKFGNYNYIQQLGKRLTLSKLRSFTTAGNIVQMCVWEGNDL